MSAKPTPINERSQPDWLWPCLGENGAWQGERTIAGQPFVIRGGILRAKSLVSKSQAQTEETFAYKWKRRDTFDTPVGLARMRAWLVERYGEIEKATWLADYGGNPLLLDAGCGAAMSALELFGAMLPQTRYIGVDISEAVDVAATRFAERGFKNAAFIQADLTQLPVAENTVDLIFSEGVLHHTDSTRGALLALARLLKQGGRFLFYVYRRKGPLREFTDDLIRGKLQAIAPSEAWKAIEPLTELGIALGKLKVEIDIPENIEVLGIPAGRIDVQRLFYWHVAKMYYHPDLTFEEMNHINFDWYAPANAFRQSPEEVRLWCDEAGLEVEREVVQDAGITVVARKR